ncbi:GNAT family N-acetyltransferase [Streptomyces sp. BA2]|uniref:GNAT family N-acetyltransferase n=1 Tax=Streptomyces sp. BA2 TaxID=436595 RepID=UPI001F2F5AFF|nr:GNAT family N-acetyltransferase [Streptomyces sp. BA2]
MPTVIRSAVTADAPALAALHARARATYYPEGLPDEAVDGTAMWQAGIERRGGHVLCAVREGLIVGLASFRTPEGEAADTVVLFQFHVDPDHWRAGVGADLHAACVEEWRADGIREASLDVHRENRRAQAFYVRHGWRPEDPGEGASTHLRMRLCLTDLPAGE